MTRANPDCRRATLFITRKYPPAIGGMEEFSRSLYESYDGEKDLIALRRGQRWLPVWLTGAAWATYRRRGQVAHIHLGDGMLAMFARLLEAVGRAPVTVTVHGQEVTRNVPPYTWLVRRGVRFLGRKAIAVSPYTQEECRRIAGAGVAMIPNGVDVGRFGSIHQANGEALAVTRAELGLPVSGHVVVTVGRLVERKGVAWFIREVLPRLAPDVHYVVVGDGPNRVAVETAANGEARATLVGTQADSYIDRLYSVADLFVAPNVPVPGRPEGYGLTPAEAAAAGLPVLVSKLEGLADMAAVTGLGTVEPGDSDAWRLAVEAALADPDSARATKPARSWDDVASEYAALFAEIAREPQIAIRRLNANRPA